MTENRGYICALGVLLLFGCTNTLRTLPRDYSLGAKDEAVVIGRLVFDVEKPPAPFFANLMRLGLVVRNEATQRDYTWFCDRTGLGPRSCRLDSRTHGLKWEQAKFNTWGRLGFRGQGGTVVSVAEVGGSLRTSLRTRSNHFGKDIRASLSP